MGGCSKCGCKKFFWNPVSACEALADRIGRRVPETEATVNKAGVEVTTRIGGGSTVDIHDSRDALRNCTCGHHYNYHS